MIKGVNSIYVDFLDYDEVAHHAGMARPESLASLRGLDWVVGIIDKARKYAPRNYEIILLSDHGQSQGPTFKQLHNGKTIEEYLNDYTNGSNEINVSMKPAEEQKSIRTLLFTSKNRSKNNRLKQPEESVHKSKIIFTGSGNLGNVWFKSYKHRLSVEEINEYYPKLIEKLLNTEGVGMIIVKTNDGSECIAKNGTLNLNSSKVYKQNPLQKYSKHDRKSLLRLSNMDNAPDIIIISSYNELTGEVYAFEELVGNHGGIGGWQTEAILLHPKKLKINDKFQDDGDIVGAENVHKILKSWIKH
jgi:hypothetical protein